MAKENSSATRQADRLERFEGRMADTDTGGPARQQHRSGVDRSGNHERRLDFIGEATEAVDDEEPTTRYLLRTEPER